MSLPEKPVPPSLIKYSELLATWLKELGYTHCFFVAGGGCMHLIDGFRHHFKMAAVVHEMSAGVAAEHFNECSTDGKAFALVTSGPGFTNIVTAVAGCYTERRPLLVIAGQVKSTDLITGRLRQRGMQEIDGSAITAPITVHSRCLRKPLCRADLRAIAEAAYHPHPGPVVIEVCLDVQGCQVDPVELNAAPQSPDTHFEDSSLLGGEDARTQARWLAGHLSGAKRPLLLLGGQVSREVAWRLLPILEQAGVPVMTTTSAMDRVPCDSPVWAGRPNSWGGQRCANLLVGQADVIVGVGVQWDLQQTGFNWQEYAPCAKLYQVYPSVEELGKGHPVLAGAVAAVPDEILLSLAQALDWTDREDWRGYIRRAQALVPTLEPANVAREGYHSNYAFLQKLTRALRAEDVIAMTSSGNCFTGALQVAELKRGQFATTSTAFASMGYGLATAIGAAMAQPEARIIHFEGDGGFSQNLQELAIIGVNKLNVKMFLMENGGYSSIRATQRKFFGGAYVGCDQATGLGFPDWPTLFAAYGIPCRYLKPEEATSERLALLLDAPGAEAWIVSVDPEEPNFPVVASRILPDGKMESAPLHQQLPPLDPAILAEVGRYLPEGAAS